MTFCIFADFILSQRKLDVVFFDNTFWCGATPYKISQYEKRRVLNGVDYISPKVEKASLSIL
jgi:hypothetical protein